VTLGPRGFFMLGGQEIKKKACFCEQKLCNFSKIIKKTIKEYKTKSWVNKKVDEINGR
jgi:hypothetical protein